MMFIYPYKAGSASVKALCKELGAKRIKLRNSKFKGSPDKWVLNWGRSSLSDEAMKCRILNHPRAVEIAGNKLLAFTKLQRDGVSTVEFCTVKGEAQEWLDEGHSVVCRKVLRGHSGEGIEVVEPKGTLIDCPLYTRYQKRSAEYRIHIFLGEVIGIQRKVRNPEVPVEEVNWQVRSHNNGFIFQRKDVNPPLCVIEQSALAVKALGLEFGAVDVIYNGHHDKAYVLEVNTAPGLVGSTLEEYVDAIKGVQ